MCEPPFPLHFSPRDADEHGPGVGATIAHPPARREALHLVHSLQRGRHLSGEGAPFHRFLREPTNLVSHFGEHLDRSWPPVDMVGLGKCDCDWCVEEGLFDDA